MFHFSPFLMLFPFCYVLWKINIDLFGYCYICALVLTFYVHNSIFFSACQFTMHLLVSDFIHQPCFVILHASLSAWYGVASLVCCVPHISLALVGLPFSPFYSCDFAISHFGMFWLQSVPLTRCKSVVALSELKLVAFFCVLSLLHASLSFFSFYLIKNGLNHSTCLCINFSNKRLSYLIVSRSQHNVGTTWRFLTESFSAFPLTFYIDNPICLFYIMILYLLMLANYGSFYSEPASMQLFILFLK